MRNALRLAVVVLLCMFANDARAGLEIGKVPKNITLQQKLGGRLDGAPWSSAEFMNKVTILFYVDPDKKNLNDNASETLKKEAFSREKFQSYGIINMAATIMPNFAISASLKKKQKAYPDTIYVRDYDRMLVKQWGLADDNSDVLVFDKAGNLIFRKDGKLTEEDIKAMISLIRDNLDK